MCSMQEGITTLQLVESMRHDREPLRKALAVARALTQFLYELDDDDPADDEGAVSDALAMARDHADAVVRAIAPLTRKSRRRS